MEKSNINHHISRQFNQEIEDIRNKVLRMGGLVQQQMEMAVQAIVQSDVELAEKVIQQDEDVNEMEKQIDEECMLILARRQPAAFDLRLLISVIKTIGDLERIGDQAERIARMAIQLQDIDQKANYHELEHLTELVKSMLSGALDAFARFSVDSALKTFKEDKKVDQEYVSIFRQLTAQMMEDPRNIKRALNVLNVNRSLERIGDHTCNICEYIIYTIKGEDVRHMSTDEMEEKIQN